MLNENQIEMSQFPFQRSPAMLQHLLFSEIFHRIFYLGVFIGYKLKAQNCLMGSFRFQQWFLLYRPLILMFILRSTDSAFKVLVDFETIFVIIAKSIERP